MKKLDTNAGLEETLRQSYPSWKFVFLAPLLMSAAVMSMGWLFIPSKVTSETKKALGIHSEYKRHEVTQYLKNEGNGRFSGPYKLGEKVTDAYVDPATQGNRSLFGQLDGQNDRVELKSEGYLLGPDISRILYNGRQISVLDKPATLIGLEDVDKDGKKDINILTLHYSGMP